MDAQMDSIREAFEADLARVCEIASVRFNALVRAKLNEWAARFPRHSFVAMEGHGRMSIDVNPPVCGVDVLNYASAHQYRGALAEIISEAVALVDFYNDMEQKVALFCDRYDTRPE